MTIAEAEKFYKKDKQQYIVKNRPGFEKWYQNNFNEKNAYLNIDQIQELVDKIIMWYNFKFPNRKLEEGVIDTRFLNLQNIGDKMDIRQLLYRLSHSEYCVMEANYRTSSAYVDQSNNINFGIKVANEEFDLNCIYIKENGTLNYDSKQKYNITSRSIEDFYEDYKNDKRFDMLEVRRCIKRHENDLILRNHIICAVREGLIYDAHTTPEKGMYRAEEFVNDMLEYYEDIDLYNHNYIPKKEEIKEEPKKNILRRITKR